MTITHWDGMLANATTFRSGSATNERLSLSARITGNPESAGINRHVVGDARALQERK